MRKAGVFLIRFRRRVKNVCLIALNSCTVGVNHLCISEKRTKRWAASYYSLTDVDLRWPKRRSFELARINNELTSAAARPSSSSFFPRCKDDWHPLYCSCCANLKGKGLPHLWRHLAWQANALLIIPLAHKPMLLFYPYHDVKTVGKN